MDPYGLAELSQEMMKVALRLAELSKPRPVADVSPEHLRWIIQARRLRDRYFPSGLFADPAWDMLLDLMAARLEDRRVSISSLCTASAVPASTALRWIAVLEREKLIVRSNDPHDGRRVYVTLTDDAAARLTEYVTATGGGVGV